MKKLSIYGLNGTPAINSPDVSQLIARISRVERVTPYKLGGGSFASSEFSPIDSAGVVDGKLNLASSGALNFKGIMAPNVVDGQFTVACPSDSTATIYYDGTNSSRVIVIRRADGTTSTVPPSNITISGLTATASYQAFPYWVPYNSCGVGWSPGNVGTPQIAFSTAATTTTLNQATWNQSLAGREPLGNFSWTQPSGGSSSGASTPTEPPARQPGTCVRLGTFIDYLGAFAAEEIVQRLHPQKDWWHLETDQGLVLQCTPDHNMYHALRGRVEAQTIGVGEKVITRFGEQTIAKSYHFMHACQKVEVVMPRGHLFWANSFLSHNGKIQLPQ